MVGYSLKRKNTNRPRRPAMSSCEMLQPKPDFNQQRRTIRDALTGRIIQAKLSIGQSNDKYEQEANHVADEVMRMPESKVQHKAEAEDNIEAGKEKEGETESIQTKRAINDPLTVSTSLQRKIQSLKNGGQALSKSERAFFEPRFGKDFSQVRLYKDLRATKAARSINAKAFTLGRNVVFGANQFHPESSEGRHLLAHELTHVVQQGGRTSLASPFPFIQRVGGRTGARVQRPYNRNTYLSLVRLSIIWFSNQLRARKTLSGMLKNMYTMLARSGNVRWKSSTGVVTVGSVVRYRPPGRGARPINLQLELNEANPRTEQRAGYFDAANNKIVIFVHKTKTMGELRRTLFHEGMHLAVHILKTQRAAALGSPKSVAVKALRKSLSRTKEIATLKKRLLTLNTELNKRRSARGVALITASTVDTTAQGLWEEIVVRAETFYYEILPWLKTGARRGSRPIPNYLDRKSLKKTYLKTYNFINDADLRNLTVQETRMIGIIYSFLYWKLRDLIKQRGVGNAYISRAKHPNTKVYTIRGRRPLPALGPMLKLPDPRKRGIQKIIEAVRKPPF